MPPACSRPSPQIVQPNRLRRHNLGRVSVGLGQFLPWIIPLESLTGEFLGHDSIPGLPFNFRKEMPRVVMWQRFHFAFL